jgi:hypothetical protein
MSVITSQLPPPPMQHQPPPRMMGGGHHGPRYPPPCHFNSDHHPSPFPSGPRPRMSYQPYRPFPRPPHPHAPNTGDANVEYDGRRLRKSLVRKTVDYNAAIVTGLQV